MDGPKILRMTPEDFQELLHWQYLHGLNIQPPPHFFWQTWPDATENLIYDFQHYATINN